MKKVNCTECDGKGYHSHLKINPQCQSCKGSGFVDLIYLTEVGNDSDRLQEIKEEVAKERGFKDWKTFTYQKYASERKEGQDEVTRRYAKECVEATLKKIIEDNKYLPNLEEGEDVYVVDVDDLIIENIVLL